MIGFLCALLIFCPVTASPHKTPPLKGPTQSMAMPPQSIADAVASDGFRVRIYNWFDSTGQDRSVSLVRSGAPDPAGFRGGYMRNYSLWVNGERRNVTSSDPDHPGFGYTVHHRIDNTDPENPAFPADSSRNYDAIFDDTVFAGKHHSIHQYTYCYKVGGQPMKTTIQHVYKNGEDHPIFAVTYDTSQATPNSIMADSRSPYGDFDYDGGHNATVAGVGWGDHYRFVTQDQTTLTMASGWRYDEPNTVPYALTYTLAPDAEMGLVQTQTYLQHDLGGYGGYTLWNTREPDGPMPDDWMWPFQINQYALPYSTTSKRLAMGTNYGAVGQTSYPSYGGERSLSGYPYQSYSVFIVLGSHRAKDVARQVQAVEVVQSARLDAAAGLRLLTAVPAGIARPDTTTLGGPPGYNPVYATWELAADNDAAQMNLTLSVDHGTLFKPTFRVHNWQSDQPPASVLCNGRPLLADHLQGYWASVDEVTHTLWLTVGSQVGKRTPLTLSISAPERKQKHFASFR